jgi:hypothetical protein
MGVTNCDGAAETKDNERNRDFSPTIQTNQLSGARNQCRKWEVTWSACLPPKVHDGVPTLRCGICFLSYRFNKLHIDAEGHLNAPVNIE